MARSTFKQTLKIQLSFCTAFMSDLYTYENTKHTTTNKENNIYYRTLTMR